MLTSHSYALSSNAVYPRETETRENFRRHRRSADQTRSRCNYISAPFCTGNYVSNVCTKIACKMRKNSLLLLFHIILQKQKNSRRKFGDDNNHKYNWGTGTPPPHATRWRVVIALSNVPSLTQYSRPPSLKSSSLIIFPSLLSIWKFLIERWNSVFWSVDADKSCGLNDKHGRSEIFTKILC